MANQILCTQCGRRPPLYQLEEGHRLCLDCYSKYQEILNQQIQQGLALANYCSDMIDYQIGLSDVSPRVEMPKPVHVHHSGNFNNIRVEGSMVGSINTGEVGKIDVALDNVRAGGQSALANQLQRLTQAVLESKELTQQARDEAIEALSYLAEQATLPKEQRRRSIGKTMLAKLERLMNDSASLLALWQVADPWVHRLF
jgi:hypothetical protein